LGVLHRDRLLFGSHGHHRLNCMYKANPRILIFQTQPAATPVATGVRSSTFVTGRHSMTATAVMPSTMSRMPVSAVMMSVAIPVPRVVPAVVSMTTPTAVRGGPVGWLRKVLKGRGIVGLRSVICLRRVVGGSRSAIPAADLISAARVITAPVGITTLALGLYAGIDRARGEDDDSCEKSDSQLHSHRALLTGICSTCRHAALPQVEDSMHTQIDNAGCHSLVDPIWNWLFGVKAAWRLGIGRITGQLRSEAMELGGLNPLLRWTWRVLVAWRSQRRLSQA